MKKLLVLATSILGTNLAFGQSYQTFGTLGISDLGDGNNIRAGLRHFFSEKKVLGPLDEFSYINAQSFVEANLFRSDFQDNESVAGVWHTESGFFVGANYTNSDVEFILNGQNDFESHSATIGYQFNEQYSFSASYQDSDLGGFNTVFNAAYKHALQGSDYIGFSLTTNSGTGFVTLSSKYFTDLGQGRYLTVFGSFTDFDHGGENWSFGSEYYFSEATSVSAEVGDDDYYALAAKHFFTPNLAVALSYSDFDGADDSTFALGLDARF